MTDPNDKDGGASHLAGAQSLARALTLLRLVAQSGKKGMRLIDATRQAGLTRSTAHRLIRALEHEGFIEQEASTERYFLGFESYALGLVAESRFNFVHAALPFAVKAAELSGDTAVLHVRRGDDSICISREEGSYPIRTHTAHPGDTHPLGIGAGGLAILATLDDDEVAKILHRQASEMHAKYGVTFNDSMASVAQARKVGYSINPGRVFPDSWAIGVALIDSAGICRGALALAGIPSRIGPPRSDELGVTLSRIAADFTSNWKMAGA